MGMCCSCRGLFRFKDCLGLRAKRDEVNLNIVRLKNIARVCMSLFAFCCCVKTLTGSNYGKKRFISYYTSRSHSITEGSQSSNSNRTWSRNREVSLLTGLLPMTSAQSPFYTTQDFLPKGCTTHINQPLRRFFYEHRPVRSGESLRWVPLLPMTLGCVKLTIRANREKINIWTRQCVYSYCLYTSIFVSCLACLASPICFYFEPFGNAITCQPNKAPSHFPAPSENVWL